MEDKKSSAIIAGILVGAAIVGAAIAVYHARSQEPEVRDIDGIVDQARNTVQRLDEAVEMLRKSAGHHQIKKA